MHYVGNQAENGRANKHTMHDLLKVIRSCIGEYADVDLTQ